MVRMNDQLQQPRISTQEKVVYSSRPGPVADARRPATGPSIFSPFVIREILKNALMHLSIVARVRKRIHSVQNSPVEEIERQHRLIWSAYVSALDAVGGLTRVQGARILEIGPGPILANGVRFIAHGAATYTALERYDLFRRDEAVRSAYTGLITALPEPMRNRCAGLVNQAVERPLFDGRIVTKNLTVEEAAAQLPHMSFDVILSHNVLEHVQDLNATLTNMKTLLAPQAIMIHRVDVSTHTDRADVHPLWQLTIPDFVWAMMYSRRAYPNRVRPATYRALATQLGLETAHYQATTRLSDDRVEAIRSRLTRRHASLPLDDLSTLDFLWILRSADRPE
jgi:SAM-dependent methyltransferase